MKCISCGYDFDVKIASNVVSKNCKVLTNMTTVLTIQCGKIFQIPVSSKTMMSVKED